jgi:thiol-disulfide isomerase/thioredoxin
MRQATMLVVSVLAVLACDTTAHAQPTQAEARAVSPVAPAPAAAAPGTPLSAAAAQLLHLLDQRVDDEAVELGSRLIREHPEDAPLHALYVISLSQYGGWMEALQLSEEYTAQWPDDAWVQVARGKLLREPTRTEEALKAAARARDLAPEDVDIARHVMSIYSAHSRYRQAIAVADSFIDSGRATAGLRLGKASALRTMATLPGRPDTAAARLAERELESAVAEAPSSAAVYLAAAERYLWDRRTADALPLLDRAVALSPHSGPVRSAYWRGISARTDIAAAEKRAMIDADINAYLDARQHAVGALLAVAEHYRFPRDDERFNLMADRIQQEHADTWQAASSAYSRASMAFISAREQATTRADSMAAMRQFRDTLWPITALPGANSSVLSSAYSAIYYTLEQDSTSSADELLSVFERLEEHSSWPSASRRHVSLPVALAERGSRLDYAEQLARAGLGPLEDAVEWSREYATVDEYAEWLDRAKSNHHATVGWVLFHKGDIAEAKRELEKAHEALNTAPAPPYRLGRIAEAGGDVEAAERWYATGRGRENWARHSSEALERLYLARNESLDGFDEYLAAIDERDVARRRAKVESERIAEPQSLPAFEHDWMHGGRFSSESLKGKVAVINFWGVWCGPCVREAPDIQKFADRFRDHPDVVFITVANDNDLDTTRDFMKEKGYDFPVIVDEGLARLTNIFGWPTTLFVDREGSIVFSYLGASLHLVDEYTWRVEALLGRAVADTDAQPQPQSAPGQDAPLSAAAAQLLQLLDQRVEDEAVELGSRLIREHPADAALHALHAISLREYHHFGEALRLSEEQVTRWPDDAWVQVARGYVIRDWTLTEVALAAAARARGLAPDSPEIALYVMRIHSWHSARERAVALADSVIASGRATAALRVEKASALRAMAAQPGRRDTAAEALAQRELESALGEMPPSAAAYLAAGERLLWDRRPAEALTLLERAAELSPRSSQIRRAYWRGISAQTEIAADRKRAMVQADIDAWLDARRHAVGARHAVAEYYARIGDTERANLMAELIQQEHAGTWQAAQLAYSRARDEYWARMDAIADAAAVLGAAARHADRMAAERRFRDMLQSIITMPGANSAVLHGAYGDLFSSLAQDSTTSADELLAAFERMEENHPGAIGRYSRQRQTGARHVTLPVALAERRSHLDHAERLARTGLQVMEDDLEQWGPVHLAVAEYAEAMDRVNADYHAAIGWVLFHRGDIAEAQRELEKALEALNTSPTPPYRLGRIAEAEGDIEAAERWYATGRGRESWGRRSSEALERLYLARNESLDGFDEYLAAIDERDVARRRAKVESDRIAESEPLPDFEHDWMNGGRFSSESLAGKIAVINFWGVWCGPCVREAPDIQKFAEKFRDHPDVVFITVANDNDLDTTRDFMKEKGYDFPVIFDEGLVRLAHISAFPTTLFVDRDGRIVFSYVGASLWLVDEYTWRVEALLGRTVADGHAQAHAP